MRKLPAKIRRRIKKEAKAWDSSISKEKPEGCWQQPKGYQR
jgi:hypothetical protein